MGIKIALAGNPNCGKTTLFNSLTGSNQFVGNWPGVTVEKKEGKLKNSKDIIVTDLPGVYSLSPYTMEEIVARDYLVNERPDAILNIVDGTNLERNLYLSTQLIELGIPVVIAVNMMDIVRKNGDIIDIQKLSKALECPVVEISALKNEGVNEAVDAAVKFIGEYKYKPHHNFSGNVEHALAHIEEVTVHHMPENQQRWYSIKIFERDSEVLKKLNLSKEVLEHIENDIKVTEEYFDDDAEGIITNERYNYITDIVKDCYKKKNPMQMSVSERIDSIVTNRILALPIFVAIMFMVYYISVSTVGTWATDWANNGLFGEGWHLIGSKEYSQAVENYKMPLLKIESFEQAAAQQGIEAENAQDLIASAKITDENGNVVDSFSVTYEDYQAALNVPEPSAEDYGIWVPGIPVVIENILVKLNCADWLKSLILDGIVAGVGSVLGFVPQLLVLFLLLAFLEACGYMSRIAFVLDKLFRKFGLSGKSFIPILIGTGCGVPGIMASRTIENEADRKMTIITTTFIPCGAKLPVIALISGALFSGAWWVAPSAYFIGIMSILFSGIILKKTKLFASEASPFVMELPPYHMPTLVNLLHSMWERGWSFIKKAGTVILLSAVVLWFLMNFGWENGSFGMLSNLDNSILAVIGRFFAPIFAPLGFGNWQSTVATATGLIAKENVVNTFGVLFGTAEVAENGWQIWDIMQQMYTPVSAYAFLMFNLLCAPCVAAMGAIKREMNNGKWTVFAIGYQCLFAYLVSFVIYQLGSFFTVGGNVIGAVLAVLVIAFGVYMLVRKPSKR